jgi:predicted RNA-binding Zn ribbon-like protein
LETDFQLVAGHPALDFVNTLDWRFREAGAEDLLKSYGDLLRFIEQSKLLPPKQTRRLEHSARVLATCKELREAIAEIFYARLHGLKPSAATQRTVEGYFKAALGEQKLNWSQSPRVTWEWSQALDAEVALRAIAASALDLMTSDAVDRVRECNNPECRWLFLDTSKNHTRRWCDMKVCGNRMKARRFKAQRKKRG